MPEGLLTRIIAQVRALMPEDWAGNAGRRFRSTVYTLSEFSRKLKLADRGREAPDLAWRAVRGAASEKHAKAVSDYANAENARIQARLGHSTFDAKARQEESTARKIAAEATIAEVNAVKARLELLHLLQGVRALPEVDAQGNIIMRRIPDAVSWEPVARAFTRSRLIVLLGPPGSGKETQEGLLTRLLGIPGISTGDLLREEIMAGSPLGKAAQEIMSAGGLVGDEIINPMVAQRLLAPSAAHGCILDGYPRTVEQAEFLDRVLLDRQVDTPVVLHLDVPRGTLIRRLTARRQCPKCKRIYNLMHEPPRASGLCDDDGNPLITRKDDTVEAAERRLRSYDEVTGPVLTYYAERRRLHTVDAQRQPDQVAGEISDLVTSLYLA